MRDRTAPQTLIVIVTLATLIAGAPSGASAQILDIGGTPVLYGQAGDRHRMHAYMGGQLMGIGALAQSAADDERYLSRFGGGIGLFGGVRLDPLFALEGNWTFALHDEVGGQQQDLDSIYIMTVTADLKVHLPTAGPMEPYAQVGGGLLLSGGIYLDDRNIDLPDTIFSVGATFTAGVGLDIWVTRHICMGGRVLYRGLALGEQREERQDVTIRNYIHGISVDAMASIHF